MVFGQLENLLVALTYSGSNSNADVLIQSWQQFFTQQKYQIVPVNDSRPHYTFCIGDSVYLQDLQGRLLQLDFINNHLDYQRSHRGKSELIAKALGVQKKGLKVLDLSFGLGIDSIFLHQIGCEVTAVERHPLLYALISESLVKSNLPIKIHFANSAEYLEQMIKNNQPNEFDALYFDPMYPEKKKSALPRKEMVFFRDLVGSDDDADLVLQKALQIPDQRIVVKRPLKAPSLSGQVIHQFIGKTVRYDLYKGKK